MKNTTKRIKLHRLLFLVISALLSFCIIASCGGGASSSVDSSTESSIYSSEIYSSSSSELSSSSSSSSSSEEESSSSLENSSITSEESSSEEVSSGEEKPETYEVRLYSLMPESGSLMESFVIRTKTGKLIVIDGGIDSAGKDADPYMPAALRAIAGVGQNDYVEVEAWFLSHAHKDHFYELYKTLRDNYANKNFVINNFYFDFPEFGTDEYPNMGDDYDELELLKGVLDKYAEARNIPVTGDSYYDDLNGAVINADTIADSSADMEIDGVSFEFILTWAKSNGTSINDNSLIMKAYVEGQSILFLNDAGSKQSSVLKYKHAEEIKSDIVQMAHHGQKGVTEAIYELVGAKVRLWPTPLWVWNDTTTYEIGTTRQWVNNGVDFTTSSEYDIVSCLYKNYPSDRTSVNAWKAVIDEMSIPLPYAPAM